MTLISLNKNCIFCGEEIFSKTKTSLKKREERKFCSRLCANRKRGIETREEKSPLWKGGRNKDGNGYITILDPRLKNLPSKYRKILEHRYVMEIHLGRHLKSYETVHHKNGSRDDNRIENLELRVGHHGPGSTHKHCVTCKCFEGVI